MCEYSRLEATQHLQLPNIEDQCVNLGWGGGGGGGGGSWGLEATHHSTDLRPYQCTMDSSYESHGY